ncbi:MAG TPA: LD-carboxypeptidase [Candidatus Dormibacteraeota bacterium]|nr:LD-carboxypeptidase [Candidatus Dormibacteraeota bacterium]
MRKPAPLRPGDLIAVTAPAAAVDVAAVEAGARLLERAGFTVRIGETVGKQAGYLAGTDAERLAELQALFADRTVRAIIAARGGYGSGRLLPRFDVETARRHSKLFVGYSDVTFLLVELVQRANLVVFHGPMVADFAANPTGTEALLRMLSGDRTGWNLRAREIVQPGTGEGVIVGGCLSILVAGLGTPHAVDTTGRLLFLEDVNEKPFRVDRMLTQLRQAGKLDGVAGVLFGDMTGCGHAGDAVTVRDVIREAFAGARYPVVFGLPTGHGGGTATLPLGVRARLAGERLHLLESPLAE